MKLARRAEESISIAFLDVITCGIGAIILLLMISKPPPVAAPAPVDDPRVAQIATLQRQLFTVQDEHHQLEAELATTTPQLHGLEEESKRLRDALLATEMRSRSAEQAAARDAEELGKLKIAQQSLSEEMRRLQAERKKAKAALVGGIPIDSEYVIFVVDTSESMTAHAWGTLKQQISDTLAVYPRIKGIQIMNDNGTYMFPATERQWQPDSQALRDRILAGLDDWGPKGHPPYSASNPKQGIYTAIKDFYSADKKISIYVLGDEFDDNSIDAVVNYVASINPRDAQGRPRVRIHGIGFPTRFGSGTLYQPTGIRFAALMRKLTRQNGGTFVGLNAYR